MDPTYVRDEPGQSPMGMDLVPECPSGSEAAEVGRIRIDPTTRQNIGLRTARVERRDLTRSIRAVGRVAYDERRVSHVHTKVQGWVESLRVDFVGQQVEKGEPLLELYSPDLVSTQEELLLAARYLDTTRSSAFETVREGGESLFEATKRRLELWDVPQRDIDRLLETGRVDRTLTLYAPASGIVTRLGVRSGMEVRPNENLYTVANLSSVWILGEVYEHELPWIELGQRGVVELAALPDLELEGRLTWVAPFLDPETRTAEVRLELPNPDGRLKPEMFGSVRIAASPREDVLVVPDPALIRSGRRTLAIVHLGDGNFEPREIQIGMESAEGWVEVQQGLEEGEEVVVSSQFLIDSESNLREAARALLDATSERASGGEGRAGSGAMPGAMDAGRHDHHGPDPAPAREG